MDKICPVWLEKTYRRNLNNAQRVLCLFTQIKRVLTAKSDMLQTHKRDVETNLQFS